MAEVFPDTPASLLSCIEHHRGGHHAYEAAWETFWTIYHSALRWAVVAAFRRCNWHHVPQDLLEETMADVVVSFYKAEFSYDPAKGKFRNYLSQLIEWRVRDKLDQLPQNRPLPLNFDLEPSEGGEHGGEEPPDAILETKEQKAHQTALLNLLLEDVRRRVSPQTFMLFEMTKLLGHSPESVAREFNVSRNVVDNAVRRVLKKLKELGTLPEYRREYFL